MKALSLWQPWASLWANGAKQFETRSWATSYRGPIAIHAAIKKPSGIWGVVETIIDRVREALGIVDPDELPRGAIIATAELVGCHQIVKVGWTGTAERRTAWVDKMLNPHYPTEREILFGDWTPGRYAWEIANIKILESPIPAKGHQGLWNWEAEL